MNKRNLIAVGAIVSVSLFSSVAIAQSADNSGWYIGAGLGKSKAQDLNNIDSTLAGYGITSASSTDDTDTMWKMFGGYQFNRYFSAEGGYTRLGSFDINSTVTAPAAGAGSGTWKPTNVWSLAALGTLPITDQFSAFGKLGIARSDVDLNFASPGAAISQSSSSTNPLYGLGLKYDFTRNTALRGEWERYSDLGDSSTTGKSDVDTWFASVQYKF